MFSARRILPLARHVRTKSTGRANGNPKMAEILKQNAKSYRPSTAFKKNSPTSHTFTANEALENGLSDLSSVASMNTILGILEDAQKSQNSSTQNDEVKIWDNEVNTEVDTSSSSNTSAGAGTSDSAGAFYLDHFFNLTPSLPVTPNANTSYSSPTPVTSRLLYKSHASAELGKSILEYIIVRYLNDEGVSERGLAGGVEGLGIYQYQILELTSCFESKYASSRYKTDDALTMYGSLNHWQAISMHFIKRPQIAIDLLMGEVVDMVHTENLQSRIGGYDRQTTNAIDLMVDELEGNALQPSSGIHKESNDQEGKIAHYANINDKTEYATPAATSYKLPQKFSLTSPNVNSTKSDPRLISPIYTKYNLSTLKNRQYIVQLPFILNDYEVISRVLINNSDSDIFVLQGILASQSLEGAKLYDILVRLSLLRKRIGVETENKSSSTPDTMALLDPVIKSAVSTTSNLLWKGNTFTQRMSQSFLERTFDEARTISLLEQQFNTYLSIWYRLGAEDATKWCSNLVSHYLSQPLTIQELETLRNETLTYFKLQARSEKANKFIVEEEELTKLIRSLLRSTGEKVPLLF